MKLETNDPYVYIIDQTEEKIVYQTIDETETWEIYGTCNGCGECELGSTNEFIEWTGIPVGQAGACRDTRGGPEIRGDYPCRPEIKDNCPNCTLWGNYL
jgi:hypothetical protein